MSDGPLGLVAAEHRPTLGDLAAGWPPRRRRAAVAGTLVVVVALALAYLLVPRDEQVRYVVGAPVAFNGRYADSMARRPPRAGELLRVERRRADGLFLESFVVEPLTLPPYRGEPTGALPAFAVAEVAGLARRFRGFEWLREGKTRVNEAAGYSISFRAREGQRRLYGRAVLLPEPEPARPPARRGARLLLLATPAAGVSNPGEVGSRGSGALAYRSFRFGTEAP